MITNPHRGKLIVFEGLDGSGQTTQAQLLAKWFLEKRNQLAYYTKEPTDGPIGALLKLALNHRLVCARSNKPGPLDEVTMALFFAADRSDHLNNEIVPKLEDGIHVITDRYYLSSLAYQSVVAEYQWIKEINRHSIRPDLTFFLEVPAAICLKRMQAQRWHMELYEDLRNLQKVWANFVTAIDELRSSGERIEVVDGTMPVKDVHREVVQRTKNFLRSITAPAKSKRSKEQRQMDLLMGTEPLSELEIAAHREG